MTAPDREKLGALCANCSAPVGECRCRDRDEFPHCSYRQHGEPCPLHWHYHGRSVPATTADSAGHAFIPPSLR